PAASFWTALLRTAGLADDGGAMARTRARGGARAVRLSIAFCRRAAQACVMSKSEVAGVAARMREQALAFLSSLREEQAKEARLEFGADNRLDWHYIPRARKGLPLSGMTPEQRNHAFALLESALSQKGYSKAEAIRQLELVLRAIEGRTMRDPELYYFTIFG